MEGPLIIGDGCFCSAHQDCAAAALHGCALCAGAEIRRLTRMWDALLTIEKSKTAQLELDVAALQIEIERMKNAECLSCGRNSAGQEPRIFKNLTTALDKCRDEAKQCCIRDHNKDGNCDRHPRKCGHIDYALGSCEHCGGKKI